MFWAVRKVCEALAEERPLVLCFEDVHWAEPTFLDLIEYLAGWIRDAPVLLLCLARPEFLDERPAWLSGQENAASLTLSPLSTTESKQLLGALGVGGESGLRIAAAAEGNPLYAEQMAAMVAEGGDVDTIPPTIHALLAARLDRLSPAERKAIECAAVAGKEFWRDAVVALSADDERAGEGSVLISLVRRELIRPERSTDRPDDAFRFAHVLIRDAAYAAIPKETRAQLHERFADWLAAQSDAPELDELVGYHLEQAYRNREALGPVDDHTRALAERAAVLLGRAGQRAFQRDDMHAAVKLLDRAVALLTQQDPARLELARQLSRALWSTGEVARAETLLNGVLDAASITGDRRHEVYARLQRSAWRSIRDPEAGWDHVAAVAHEALPIFERAHDHVGLAEAWRHIALALSAKSRIAEATEAAEQSLRHAKRAGTFREEARAADLLATMLVRGPVAVSEATKRIQAMLADADTKPALQANLMAALAELKAMDGRFDDARRLYSAAQEIYEDLGLPFALAGVTQVAGIVELHAGDPVAAETILRRGYSVTAEVRSWRAFHATLLGYALYDQGRYDEAMSLLVATQEPPVQSELVAHIAWRSLKARLLARAGQAATADELARDAAAQAAETDDLTAHAEALAGLAEVLRLNASHDAAETARRAADLYRRKGNVIGAARMEALVSQPATR
jgi:tetratricopeptide (TPR) repeat protein